MLIKTKKTWKDFVEGPAHHGVTRRDLLKRGMATAAMSVAVPKLLMGDLVKQAMADTGSNACPTPTRNPGSIAQIYAQGGPTMGARFISEAQAASMNATMAANYGISGTNLVKLGPNMVIDSLSPFGFTLLQGPPGYPGGAAAWRTNVLNKISGGAHLGPFNADDGAGQNSGLLGGVSPFKSSQLGVDIQICANDQVAAWASGLPSAKVSGNKLAPTSLANVFTLPAGTSTLTTSQELTNASTASGNLAQAYSGVFNTAARKDGAAMLTAATCAFYGNAALASPTYGASLFTPANIPALTTNVTVAMLTAEEQAQIAAFYQSAAGVAGGIVIEFGGRDYHGQSPQNNIAPADIEEARAIVMWLAACDAAKAPGAMIYLSNGQAIANGVAAVTATINGANANLMAPVAQGDAGGSYNAGLAIFYDPKGSPPQAKFTGTVNATNGNASVSSLVGSSTEAVAGLYMSALAWINGGTVPASALAAMQAAGVGSQPSNTMLF